MAESNYFMTSKTDEFKDVNRMIYREDMQASGLIIPVEVGRLDYGDVRTVSFPAGLVPPTAEQVAFFNKSDDTQAGSIETVGSRIDLEELKGQVEHFVVSALANGRNPILAYTDEASQDEIYTFQSIFPQQQNGIREMSDTPTDQGQQEQFGLYL